MSYIGNQPTTQHFPVDFFNGDGTTVSFIMGTSPGSITAIDVHVGGVYQYPGLGYTVSGKTITFTSAPPTGTNNICVVHKGVQVNIPVPADGSVTASKMSSGQFGGDYIKITDTKASGTTSGTFTSGAWQTRDLNTIDTDTGGYADLASNQFTLQPGTYIIKSSAPAYVVNNHKLKLYNITDASDEIIGQTTYCYSAGTQSTHAFLSGLFTITSAKTFELQHRCQTSRSTDGFGPAASFGVNEIYTVVELWKVK